jgi:hypothetical protein
LPSRALKASVSRTVKLTEPDYSHAAKRFIRWRTRAGKAKRDPHAKLISRRDMLRRQLARVRKLLRLRRLRE